MKIIRDGYLYTTITPALRWYVVMVGNADEARKAKAKGWPCLIIPRPGHMSKTNEVSTS